MTFQEVFDLIPIRHDWNSMFMLIGIVQGFFLCMVIAIKSSADNQSMRILGWFILATSLISLDVYACYTGLMKYVVFLNDSTEPLVLLLGPLLYLLIYSLIKKEKITLKKSWFHFVPAVLYLLISIDYFLLSNAFKMNAYTNAFYPEISDIPDVKIANWFTYTVRDQWRWILLSSLCFYLILCIVFTFQNKGRFPSLKPFSLEVNKYTFTKISILGLFAILLTIFLVYLLNEDDGGDHIIILFFTLIILIISFLMLAESKFFDKSWVADKYDTSGLKSDHKNIYNKIIAFFEKDPFYLESTCTLKTMGKKLDIPPNYISQAINTENGQNFNDFINEFRIKEACKRLQSKDFKHLNVEGIGHSTGFNSKSAFYAAFKKYTGLTPKAFADQNVPGT